ncbi:MAG: alanine racemase [Terriglobales bacterium]
MLFGQTVMAFIPDAAHLPAGLPLSAPVEAGILTPALVIDLDAVEANITATLRLLGGDAGRWQPHVKTAKLARVMAALCARGVLHCKTATTLEALTACQAGFQEVLLAFPAEGPRGQRLRELAAAYPAVSLAATVEHPAQVAAWRGSRVALYIDVNCGMDRTGIELSRQAEITALAAAIRAAGVRFAGLHAYEGHLQDADLAARAAAAHGAYGKILALALHLAAQGLPPPTIITSGTPALPGALSFPGFQSAGLVHRVSAGTVVYGDLTSQSQLPAEWGYGLAAWVLTTVVSHPAPGIATCDAGHKTVSADAGLPNCAVAGRPELEPLRPSEEHLPLRVAPGAALPALGQRLYLAPRHVCPTVNNFDQAILVRAGQIVALEPVTARGRESPLALAPQRPAAPRS